MDKGIPTSLRRLGALPLVRPMCKTLPLSIEIEYGILDTIQSTISIGTYEMPFETYAMLLNLKKILPSSKSNYVAVDRDYWISSFANHIEQVALDERWYLSRYPDVADAIKTGLVKNSIEHYCHSGYFEHRLPYQILVDVGWYLSEYSDVESAIKQQIYRSAQEHFEEIGYREGRHAYPGFALLKRNEVGGLNGASRS